MDIESAWKFLRADGRSGPVDVQHRLRQRASIGVFTAVLALALITHMVELDATLVQLLAALGRNCVWCAVTPY